MTKSAIGKLGAALGRNRERPQRGFILFFSLAIAACAYGRVCVIIDA